MKKKECGTEGVLYRVGLAAAGCLLWHCASDSVRDWWYQYSFCVIYRFTGYLCPGCGGTRALMALLRGHVWESFLYHPLVIYGVGMYVIFMGSHTLAWIGRRMTDREKARSARGLWWPVSGMKWKNGYLIAALVLLVGNFMIKNLIHLITGVDVLAWLGQQFAA